AKYAMRGNNYYSSLADKATEVVQLRKMVAFYVLRPLLIGSAPQIMLIAVMHLCQHGPVVWYAVVVGKMICQGRVAFRLVKTVVPEALISVHAFQMLSNVVRV
ncbi:hypothetical protein EJ02DRAFT_348505, partial [Clathrospora elynae]